MEPAFSKTLFWDSDVNHLHLQKNKLYIIERIVNRGSYSDWQKMLSLYSTEEITTNIVKIKDLDPKTLNFCSFYFNIPKQHFECYMKPFWTEALTNY